MLSNEPIIQRVCPAQVDPLKFLSMVNWIDGRPLLALIPSFWQGILTEALFTFRGDGSPQYNRTLWGMAKKNLKTLMLICAGLYKLHAWQAAGQKGNQCYLIASDLGQADDDLDLAKKLIRRNPVLAEEVVVKVNVIERRDNVGFLEILPGQDVQGLHGKTFLWKGHDELHTQKDYRALEALELDRTRPDAVASFASYASLSRHAGVPLVDMLKQHEAQSDPRLFVRWYSGTVEDANPAMDTPLGPTRASIDEARVSLPSWIFRRLYLNLPGQPDSAAFSADAVEACIVRGRQVLGPVSGTPYVAFVDMSGGGHDDSVLAIAHLNADGVAVLDLVLDQGPRRSGQTFDVQQTVAVFAGMVKAYGGAAVTGDSFAGHWPRQRFEQCGIAYRVADRTRSQLYAALEPLVNSGQVELLDQPKLLSQLIGLVRKGEKIDHVSAEHDDHANSAAGALVLAKAATQLPWFFRSGGVTIGSTAPPPAPAATLPSFAQALTETVKDGVETVAEMVKGGLVQNYRGQFTAILRSSSHEHLVQTLREKIAQYNVKTKLSETRSSH